MNPNSIKKLGIFLFVSLTPVNQEIQVADLTVKVESDLADGNIGCALFTNGKGLTLK